MKCYKCGIEIFGGPSTYREASGRETCANGWREEPFHELRPLFNVPSWIFKHSINCIRCGKLTDERECIPDKIEGEICSTCQQVMNKE